MFDVWKTKQNDAVL